MLTQEEECHLKLSVLSHELRNPVAIINSYLQLTEKRYPQVKEFTTWTPLMENMDFLKNLLEDLSSYTNAHKLHKENFSLIPVIESLIINCEPYVEPIPLELHTTCASIDVFLDKRKFHCALLNLIRNGAEALKGQENGKICITVSADTTTLHISVSNNGPIIPSDDLPTLFEPFVTHKTEGTGLGLALVHDIIQAHGGDIQVTSTPNETCFSLTLPLK